MFYDIASGILFMSFVDRDSIGGFVHWGQLCEGLHEVHCVVGWHVVACLPFMPAA